MTAIRYRLGAEELIELGNGKVGVDMDRRPFLSGRTKNVRLELCSAHLGFNPLDLLADVAGYVADGLGFALNTLGDLVNIPLNILSSGVDVVFNGLAGLVGQVPILGDFLAQILVLGGSLVKFGLSIPGMLLHGLGNILGGIGKTLHGLFDEPENQRKVDAAKSDIVKQAPDAQKDAIKKVLNATGVTGRNLTPNVNQQTGVVTPSSDNGAPGATPPPASGDLSTALAVGVPVAGIIALVAALS